MIEVNVPDILKGGATLEGWPVAALKQIRDNETATQSDGSPLPPAYVFVTNHAFHHDLTGASGNMQALAVGFRIPDFGPDVRYEGYAGVVGARERHAPMTALIASMRTHYEIPATFDGELPSSLESTSTGPRLVLGKHYAIPSTDGTDTVGRLHDAKVDPKSGTVHLVFELGDGQHVMVSTS